VQGRSARLPGGHAVPLAHAYPGLERPEGRRIELGIRPEFATVAREGLPVSVRRIEDLGRRRIARLELEGVPFAATLPEGMAVPAEPRLALDPTRMHIYADGRLVEGEA
jgi:glycerol transport system ATP-binding protein